ncbi:MULTISPECIES: TetR/AcrR family transcriptional regulator [Microbacterium]|uniref:TetR/AcrR family transcriptional regulator n=1 Tax=Microbacterium wangchenii TaxID=2541726 RepID=A0ABX5ST15_9MICO|nr:MULTISPECIES: TetR/AcrR family transcriptional regulator [Microbacterium]MCK6067785.1 TetR/AcrR family transcriptional regulator [Microbacterium sp. EYE_512]QBR89310.1 TetR/AcrR family transcriptional regulator [Microbacterium wangchenii]TFV81625.1 TetR/AcrR family transcriptional regulator [Microbacterium sp. dk485]TXK10983.1 TetR/AcrR family transcriptional regulator [Microbacterium wangchenii]
MADTRSAPVGRPREFDVDAAIDQALLVFWQRGYEGASLATLTEAMGISKPSMYAAFGKKDELFRLVLERYVEGPASYTARALEEPTAREVAEAMLRGAVRTTTMPDGFGGCLTVQGALTSSEGSAAAFDLLVRWRNDAGRQLEERFRRAAAEGDLPRSADPAQLSRYIMTVGFGIAVQAADGVARADLDEVASVALQAWPH